MPDAAPLSTRRAARRRPMRKDRHISRSRVRAFVATAVLAAVTIFSLAMAITSGAASRSLEEGTSAPTAPLTSRETTTAKMPAPSYRPRRDPRAVSRSELAVRVSGNHLVNAEDDTLRLVGVDRSGTETLCAEDRGIFSGPTGSASITAMKAWHINSVRLPLNEDCWLGINGLNPAYSGARYRAAVEAYVARLNHAGLYVILDVSCSAPGSEPAQAHQDMLDASHGYKLWRSIARAFKRSPAVLFDLFNEPHNLGSTTHEEWSCWANGCAEYAGMDRLVSTVRSTGARNVIVVAGLSWASNDSGWLQHEPRDPRHQLAATFHVYYDVSACIDESCWNETLLPITARVPIVNDEFGELECGNPSAIAWLNEWMSFAAAHGFSMLAWAWDAWPVGCPGVPVLITNYEGSPTPFGAAVKAFYARPDLLR